MEDSISIFLFLGFAGLFLYLVIRNLNKQQTNDWAPDDLGWQRDNQSWKYDSPSVSKKPPQAEPVISGQIHELPKASVKWVVDGDTVIVVKNWQEITIRLDSIDCPEDGQHWGDIAKFGLIKLIQKQSVHFEEHGVDGYGRTLATVYVWHEQKNEWLNVNERMVMLGHAWVLRRFYTHLPKDRQDKLNRLERWAKSKSVGLWRYENPIPPWEWRNGGGS